MKGKVKVGSDVGLIFIAYLFTKMMNILGIEKLKEAMEAFISRIFKQISSIMPQISLLPGFAARFLDLPPTY